MEWYLVHSGCFRKAAHFPVLAIDSSIAMVENFRNHGFEVPCRKRNSETHIAKVLIGSCASLKKGSSLLTFLAAGRPLFVYKVPPAASGGFEVIH